MQHLRINCVQIIVSISLNSELWIWSFTDQSIVLLLMVSLFRTVYIFLNMNTLNYDDVPSYEDLPLALLWELYWNNPTLLQEMLNKLTCKCGGLSWPSKDLPTNLLAIIDVLYPHQNSTKCPYKLGVDEPCLAVLERDIYALLGAESQDTESMLRKVEASCGKWRQLTEVLEHRFDSYLFEAAATMRNFLADRLEELAPGRMDSDLSASSRETDLVETMQTSLAENSQLSSILLFAVSGSGKTHCIRNFLANNCGFYFQACNLTPYLGKLHGPSKHDGARDTFLLAKMIEFAREVFRSREDLGNHSIKHSSVFSRVIQHWLTSLIHCRLILLHRFRDEFNQQLNNAIESERSVNLDKFHRLFPQLWLEFQTLPSKNTPDCFESMFQLSCLLPTVAKKATAAREELLQALQSPLYYCLDEAQSDLDFCITPQEAYELSF